jgi:GTP-binding protein
MFTDKVDIHIQAGKGGDGRLSFRHEKYQAKGGPDGGNGGRGGSIIFEASHNMNTLAKYRTSPRIHADDGNPGGDNRKNGRGGEDVTVRVPLGTMVYEVPDGETETDGLEPIADLATDGQTVVVAEGGRGGFGNAHFTASSRQAPRLAEKGEPGEKRRVTLELKLVADVGLVGLPNAGKSTLLSVISNAKPEIGDYPFTTLVPNLGVVDMDDSTFLVADIPGLIEGASEGKGLGDDFLRHIERTAVVLHLVSAISEDVVLDYRTIIAELGQYKIDLTQKPQIIALTKVDSITPAEQKDLIHRLEDASDAKVFPISSVAHLGLEKLLREAGKYVQATRKAREAEIKAKPLITITEKDFPNLWRVTQDEDGVWRVSGGRIEGFARRTDWDNHDAVERMRDIMRKIGVGKELAKRDVIQGDIIRIATHELEWL